MRCLHFELTDILSRIVTGSDCGPAADALQYLGLILATTVCWWP
jgi:hypothetical protein